MKCWQYIGYPVTHSFKPCQICFDRVPCRRHPNRQSCFTHAKVNLRLFCYGQELFQGGRGWQGHHWIWKSRSNSLYYVQKTTWMYWGLGRPFGRHGMTNLTQTWPESVLGLKFWPINGGTITMWFVHSVTKSVAWYTDTSTFTGDLSESNRDTAEEIVYISSKAIVSPKVILLSCIH